LKALFKYTAGICACVLLLASCKTNKNTLIHRGYHNMTARYNGYYYATESIKEGVDKIASANKDDYDRILPVFIMPNNEQAKATFPEFDKAIKKSSLVIQRHTIRDKKGNEIYSAGKWIDNNWNVIGISHYYKREFFSGIEAFEFVIRSYGKSKDKYKSMIYLARSYNEIGAVSQAEPIIGLLNNDKNISKYAKRQLPAVRADYYIRRGQYNEAAQSLIVALNNTPKWQLFFMPRKKREKARYAFILGQLYEQAHNYTKANQAYKRCISYKPAYDMVFNAQIKMARLYDLKKGNSNKLKRNLQRMTEDVKNKEYLDIIYYTLGEIEEKEKNTDMAVNYYRKSVQTSIANPKQKALSYLKLGEISFEEANYQASGAYYDSTMASLPKEYPDYDAIDARKRTLEVLVGYITTIQREDSLQRIAKMPEAQRNAFVDKMIKRLEEEEERRKEEAELLAQQNQNPTNTPNNGLPALAGSQTTGDWYFYNQTTLSFGLNDFIKKWGNRKLEDNWRRSQKGVSFDTSNDPTTEDSTGTNPKNPKNASAKNNKKNREYYLKDLPMTDAAKTRSDSLIIDSYYNLGSIYKESLHNNKKAVASFEELNKRYAENKFKLSSYYQLYRTYALMKNQAQSDYYKNKLLNEYPDSEYALLIKDPNAAAERQAKKGEVELFYTSTYATYEAGNYSEALAKCREAENKFGRNDYGSRFYYIKAMCIGRLKGIDSLEVALKKLQALYPKDDASVQAQSTLEIIYNIKHPDSAPGSSAALAAADTFKVDLAAEHFVILVLPDNNEIATPLKTSLNTFNTNYYSNMTLSITSSLFGATDQIIVIKSFRNAEEAMGYTGNLLTDKTVFSGKVTKDKVAIYPISADNLPVFYRKKSLAKYRPFYEDHYKAVK